MSSIPEKSQSFAEAAIASKPAAAVASTFFFRSDSIRKIKCTAVYPFQVAGIKLSKNVIIELLETNIKKAHVCTQKTMLNFYCVILKLLSTLFTVWDKKAALKAPAQHISMDSDSKCVAKTKDLKAQTVEKPSIDSFQSRLQEKLVKIQQHKNRLISNALKSTRSSPTSSTSSVATLSTSSSSSSIASLSSSSAVNFKTFNLEQDKVVSRSNKFREYCLIACVHAGLVIMYLQVVILGIALNTTYLPSGLIFMLVTIAIIGYIFVMVTLVDKQSRIAKSPRSSARNSSGPGRDLIKDDDVSPERHSRSKAKKFRLAIELKYKTLSKVKLL